MTRQGGSSAPPGERGIRSGGGARSVAELFWRRVAEMPKALAYRYPVGEGWEELLWEEVGRRVRHIACGLRALGLLPEQRCAIISATQVAWILADLGIQCAAAATTTVYPSSTVDEAIYILQDAEARVVFAEDAGHVERLRGRRADLPLVHKVVCFGEPPEGGDDWVIGLPALEALGERQDADHPGRFEAGIQSIEPADLATIMYTSGTTGTPKGVELAHDSWVFEAEAIAALGLLSPADHQYLWLPLSHAFGKVLVVAQLRVGFPTSVDGRVDRLVANLAAVEPTFVAAPPRVFEKVYNKIVTGAREGGRIKFALFSWALSVGREVAKRRQAGQGLSPALALKYRLADRLVLARLRRLFGRRLRFLVSGSASLSRTIAEFFHAAGVLILEGYGLTETSAATLVNRPDRYRFGTVGLPLGDTEVRLQPEDGEVLLRGRGVMRGYHRQPDLTREALDEEGWLHTGDIGELDEEGFLIIKDRKKDLIKTSGGKYVAPRALEGRLKLLCPYISQVVVYGERRNFCTALVTLDEEAIGRWACDRGIEKPYAELTQDQAVRRLVGEAVDQLNAQVASHESLKKFDILPRDLTIEAGELTPSLKVRRRAVEAHYADRLEAFYKDAVSLL